MPTVRVELGSRSYDVAVAAGLLDHAGELVAGVAGVSPARNAGVPPVSRSGASPGQSVAAGTPRHTTETPGGGMRKSLSRLPNASSAIIISDQNVADTYGRQVHDSLSSAGLPVAMIRIPSGESHKTLATVGRVFDELFAIRPAVDRNSVIVAVGGGVTGDIAGFVAATALRGMRFIQCPTTLLAAVDASVGGKTGVDTPAGKNLIGAFHQPSGVLIDVLALKTLPGEHIRNGLAECVKHAVIRDWPMLDWIGRNAVAIMAADTVVMTELVARNVAIKAAVVSADERESSIRAHLNFGHTIGHALETLAGYEGLLHGQAVSLGMVAASRIAVRKGLVAADLAAELSAVLVELGLPVRWPVADVPAVLAVMRHDKKAACGRVRMVLPTGPGRVDVFDDVDDGLLAEAVASLAGG